MFGQQALEYALAFGAILAHARAHRQRSKDRRVLRRALADFAESYGDHTEQDHDLLVETIKAGKIAAVEGV